jgi:hypothetical protein
MTQLLKYHNAVYRRTANIPDWKDIWNTVQNSKAFNTELDMVLRNSDKEEAELIDALEEEYYEYYDNIVAALIKLDGTDCWRAIALPTKMDPTALSRLGIYWSFDRKEATPHWAYEQPSRRTVVSLFRGKIDLSAVDLHATVLSNVDPGTRETGTELRFRAGSRLWIYDVALYPVLNLSEALSLSAETPKRVLPINGWRTI